MLRSSDLLIGSFKFAFLYMFSTINEKAGTRYAYGTLIGKSILLDQVRRGEAVKRCRMLKMSDQYNISTSSI